VLVHHTGKDALKGARGSSALNGGVDTEIVCVREEGEARVELTNTKQKDAPTFPKMALEAIPILGSLVLKSSGLYGGPLAGKTREGLLALHESDTGNGMTHGEWMKATGQGASTFNKSLNWLRANGYINLARGRYSVNEAGRQALSSTRSTASPLAVHSSPDASVHSPGVYRTPGVDESNELELTRAGSR
jgi:hypothetical protein